MPKDDRDILEALRFELEFLEKGGYGRSPRTPWRPTLIFEDSPTCMNYDSKDNPAPCQDCLLMRFVPQESRQEAIPCRHIPLNEAGETIESFYRSGTQPELERTFGQWLRKTIRELELERIEARQASASQPAEAQPSCCGSGTTKSTQ